MTQSFMRLSLCYFYKKKLIRKANIGLIVLIVLENLFLFYFYKARVLPNTWNALGLYISSLMFGILLIAKYYNKEITIVPNPNKTAVSKFAFIPFFILSLLYLGYKSQNVFKTIPIDPMWSDVIPAVKIVVKRFLAGSNPYLPMTALGYTTPVGYLPMHWLPFVVAELIHIDYRWTSFATFQLAIFVITYRVNKYSGYINAIVMILLALFANMLMLQYAPGIAGMSVEIMIAGYYMLMITALNKKSTFFIAFFITCCLLSRYSIMFWLPLWAFVLLISGEGKSFLRIIVTVTILVTGIYIIPFLSRDWSVFYKTNVAYSNMSWEWQHLCDTGLPCHLYNGIGFAHLFYQKYGAGNYMKGFYLLKNTFFIVNISIPIVFGIWYWFKRHKIDYRIFLMASFKIYISFFLALILVPYEYLMITGNFVSIAIFAEQARYKIKNNIQ
ncbi:MAG: hypothetical protein JST82_09540 [Bacteroidetes bacterium]|nr:hypothetical protein [Bacteroidota bacterium]